MKTEGSEVGETEVEDSRLWAEIGANEWRSGAGVSKAGKARARGQALIVGGSRSTRPKTWGLESGELGAKS